mmetsp:Transcript_1739/g.2587  ORF Transcript_1739/g.2587 Transcript_1739/m.2587 type:complete len:270 (-) Transcript_1739:178-987(-)|eukprot:CAMPEP_0197248572 /NCGR_PEP_ID=MMETSP1429-20130617/40488_1 /TAXON_ID=49237 /ORGANISM="Chaetoceros  sp., Strain UNC1202" /LENGTH=269 /DNA_ID=CAMNT_0042709835 /DNA_START=86 /DNA_END=895 /DNA_ORIENTATION=-
MNEPKRWSLDNKYIILTGASRGIGLATLRAVLTHKPAGVIICSRSQTELDKTISELQTAPSSCTPLGIQCDISTDDGRSALVNYAHEKFPRLDCLVNNVGINIRKSMQEQTDEEYHRIMQTNVDSVYFLCKRLFSLLQESNSASIVNVTSAAGVQSSGTGAAYGMSKASVIHFTKILSCEWAQYPIRVNAVAPWMCMTPMLEKALEGDENQLDKVNEWTPMGRIAKVEEIVDPILFLLMEASSYVTGQCLGIDGGLTAQGFHGPCIGSE